MLLRNLLLCLLLMISSSAWSQLSILVYDLSTEEPLQDASVSCGSVPGGKTNALGMFTLQNACTELQITMVGYLDTSVYITDARWRDASAGQVIIRVGLTAERTPVNEVVVTADKTAKRISDANISTEVMKSYLIQNKGPADLASVVEQVPGVSITDQQVNIRNGSGWSYGTGTRVMVLLDGLPMISGDAGQVQWSFIPIESADRMEVIKGAASVLYGSSALNGIINLVSETPGDKPVTRVQAYAGAYDKPRRESLRWNGNRLQSIGGLMAFHAFRKNNQSWSFNLNAANDDGYRMEEFSRRIRFGTKLIMKNRKIKGLEYGIGAGVQTGNSGSFLLWESYQLGYTSLDSGFNHTQSLKVHIDPVIRYNRGRWKHLMQGRFLALENNNDNGDPNNDQSNGSRLFYGEYRADVLAGKQFRITGGFTAMGGSTHSPLFSGNQTNGNLAVYVQAEKKIQRLTLTAGARLEHYTLNSMKETRPVMRAGLNYKAARYTFIRASWGQGYRFPSIAESYISTSAGPVKVYPNPQLKSETGWNLEAAVRQGWKIGKWYGYTDLAVFRMKFNDMMEFTFSQWSKDNSIGNMLGLGFKSVNVGRTRNTGIELSTGGSGSIGKGTLMAMAGYTWNLPLALDPYAIFIRDSQNRALSFANTRSDSGTFLKYRSRHLLRADIQYGTGRWEAGISMRYNSRIENIDAAFVQFPMNIFIPGIAEARTGNRKGALVFDARIYFRISKTVRCGIVVNNVLNKEYMTRPADLRPPRSFQLMFQGKF